MNSDTASFSCESGREHLPDPEVCRRARLSRDARFDGEFYVAVHTTGIYCRPVCSARPPAEKNVSYFQSATLAALAGFRPCLRCRPESAPNSPAWNGTSTTVQRALQLIGQGALNEGSMAELAQRLGIGERYLRKLFERELGVSPTALALNQRLLFAKKLLAETALSITEIAFASGFGSLRRFNSAVQKQFRMPPSALRNRQKAKTAGVSIELQLHYRPPYDWEGVVDFYTRHAINGVETVTPAGYQRNITLGGTAGSFALRPMAGKHALRLELQLADHRLLMPAVARIRRMFDLDANPSAIHQVLGQDKRLAPLLAQFPGIRATGHWSLYEASIRAIVGQQVSTQAARSVLGRLAVAVEHDPQRVTFPGAAAIAGLGDEHFPMPGRRRETLRALCQHCSGREDDLDIDALAALKGVGPWTIAMANLRGLGHPDIFPQKDLGLEKAWAQRPGPDITLQEQAAKWRPWGSYAANLLWRSLSL
ncbi:putative bifunctional transcriptional activator/DNA repair enzyme AlkA [Halioglobus japonicus]|nr:putative bifunctional transcriptional activator/DNA repair enzyme AlkA [Halioglobus japonicus]